MAAPPCDVRAWAPIVVLILGSFGTCNSALNAKLGSYSHFPAVAATSLYLVGTSILAVAALSHSFRSGRPFMRFRNGMKPRWYEPLGGLCGVCASFASLYLLQALGASVYVSCVVAGSLTAAVGLDHIGFCGLPVQRARWPKILALTVAMIGVAVAAVSEQHQESTDSSPEMSASSSLTTSDHHQREQARPAEAASALAATASNTLTAAHTALYVVIAAFAGALGPVQAVLNWKMGKVLSHKIQALLLSFALAGVASIVAALVIAGAQTGSLQELRTAAHNLADAPWWSWLGSIGALITLVGAATMPRRISASLYFLFLLLGELVASVMIDGFGWFGMPARKPTPQRIVGVILVLSGALLMRAHMQLGVLLEDALEFLMRVRGRTELASLAPTVELSSSDPVDRLHGIQLECPESIVSGHRQGGHSLIGRRRTRSHMATRSQASDAAGCHDDGFLPSRLEAEAVATSRTEQPFVQEAVDGPSSLHTKPAWSSQELRSDLEACGVQPGTIGGSDTTDRLPSAVGTAAAWVRTAAGARVHAPHPSPVTTATVPEAGDAAVTPSVHTSRLKRALTASHADQRSRGTASADTNDDDHGHRNGPEHQSHASFNGLRSLGSSFRLLMPGWSGRTRGHTYGGVPARGDNFATGTSGVGLLASLLHARSPGRHVAYAPHAASSSRPPAGSIGHHSHAVSSLDAIVGALLADDDDDPGASGVDGSDGALTASLLHAGDHDDGGTAPLLLDSPVLRLQHPLLARDHSVAEAHNG